MKALVILMLLAGCSAQTDVAGPRNEAVQSKPANATDIIDPSAVNPAEGSQTEGNSLQSDAEQVEAAIKRDLNHRFDEVPKWITLAGLTWTRIDRRELEKNILWGTRLHDPECDDDGGIVCDEVFLQDGKYLRSLPGNKWEIGNFRIVGDRYCMRLQRKPERCFGFLHTADWPELRLELKVEQPGPRFVHVLPASRGGMEYP